MVLFEYSGSIHRRRKEKENDRQKFGHMVNRNLYNLKFMTSFLCFNLYSGILNLEQFPSHNLRSWGVSCQTVSAED